MNGKSVLGIIFANIHEEALDTLTAQRTMGSVPFCSRYRLIDFPLSNMVESGITKIGVITNANFRSLMDHVGTGKPWDLSRKNDGLYLLPPFSVNSATMWGNRIDAIFGNIHFLNQSNQDYVLMSDCNQVLNMDYEKLFDAHEQSGADVTIAYAKDRMTEALGRNNVSLQMAPSGMSLCPEGRGEVFYSCNIVLMQKALFESLVTAAHSKNEISFQRNVLLKNVDHLKIHAYDASDCFVGTIQSLQSYYDISMRVLEKESRRRLFNPNKPISTKERDDMPSLYGPDSATKNSLVADGCIIDGTVENCIIFKGVKIGKGAVVKDSILMQDTVIGDSAKVNCVIADKDVSIKHSVELSGAPNFPVYLSKKTRI